MVEFIVMAHCNECFFEGAMVCDQTDTPICPKCGEEGLRDYPTERE